MNLLLCGFVNVSRCGCVGEADRTSKVAAVSYIDYGEACMALVLWANAAVLRASFDCLCAWVVQPFSLFSVFLRTLVLVVVAPV